MRSEQCEYAMKLMYSIVKRFSKNYKPIRILLDANLYKEYTKECSIYTYMNILIQPINAPIIIAEGNMPNQTLIKKIPVIFEDFGNYTKLTYTEIKTNKQK